MIHTTDKHSNTVMFTTETTDKHSNTVMFTTETTDKDSNTVMFTTETNLKLMSRCAFIWRWHLSVLCQILSSIVHFTCLQEWTICTMYVLSSAMQIKRMLCQHV